MKKLAVTIFVILIVVTLGLYLVSFQVRETESALVTTFSKPTGEITEPGWYFKWPFPIQQVYKFDSRMRVFSTEVEETRTAGGDPIIINTYVVWKISEPLNFFNAVKTVKTAEDELLRSRIRNTQNNIIGLHDFAEFFNNDPNQENSNFELIQQEMLADLRQAVAGASYGIEIRELGIRQLKVSEDVTRTVFERMRSERNRRAIQLESEGNAEATTIRTKAKSMSDELIAAADSRAQQIRGEGEARAAKYYEMLDEDPELAALLRKLKALETMLSSNTTYVIPTDMEPFDILKQQPNLIPAEPDEVK